MTKEDAHAYIEMLDNFLIPLIENWFSDDKIIFQSNNAICHKAKGIKVFFRKCI